MNDGTSICWYRGILQPSAASNQRDASQEASIHFSNNKTMELDNVSSWVLSHKNNWLNAEFAIFYVVFAQFNTFCGYSMEILSKEWLVKYKYLGIGTSCNPKWNPTGNKIILSVASSGPSHSNWTLVTCRFLSFIIPENNKGNENK